MKKTIYLFLCLFIAASISVTGQNETKSNRQKALLTMMNGQGNPDIKLSSDEMAALKHLKFTRELAMRTKDPLSKARLQQQVTSELRQLLDPAAASTSKSRINTPSVKPTTSVNLDALGNNFQNKLNKSIYQSAIRNKSPKTGVMKYQMDSLVNFSRDQSSWIASNKEIFEYNYNGLVTKDERLAFDPITTQWNNDDYYNVTYDEQGRITAHVRKRWENVQGKDRWILRDSMVVSYDNKGNIVMIEQYSDDKDLETGDYVLYGQNKNAHVYDQNNQEIESVYYNWDQDAHAWKPDSKSEAMYQDGRELMAASYSWDAEHSRWIGQWKFQHYPLEGYHIMGSNQYGWDYDTNQWYVTSKDFCEIIQNENGTSVRSTYSDVDYGTKDLKLRKRTVYSQQVIFQNNPEDFFRTVVTYYWSPELTSWVFESKVNNTFDTSGNLLVGVDSMWVFNGATTQHQWVIRSRVDNTVNTAGNIDEALVTNWQFDQYTGTNMLFEKRRELFFYNAANEQSERFYQQWDIAEQTWKNISKFTYFYDTAGNVVLEESYSKYIKATDTWVPSDKSEYVYNKEGEQTSYTYYNWITSTNSWRRMMKSGYEEDANGRIINESNIFWSNELEKEVINYSKQKAYDNNGNLILNLEIHADMFYDGMQMHMDIYGDKETFVYDNNNKLTSMISYDYDLENKQFVEDEKMEFLYDATHPTALASEIYYSWNPSTSSWELKGKGELTYNFEVPRSELLLPFGDDEEDGGSREVYMYFNWMPLDLTVYKWDSQASSYSLSEKTTLYYTLTEFSATEQINTTRFVVGPNPVADFLSITLPVNVQQAQFKLFDVQGRVVNEKTISGNMQVDVSNINKGIYFYQLITDTGSYKGKLIKK